MANRDFKGTSNLGRTGPGKVLVKLLLGLVVVAAIGVALRAWMAPHREDTPAKFWALAKVVARPLRPAADVMESPSDPEVRVLVARLRRECEPIARTGDRLGPIAQGRIGELDELIRIADSPIDLGGGVADMLIAGLAILATKWDSAAEGGKKLVDRVELVRKRLIEVDNLMTRAATTRLQLAELVGA